jgi:alkanesulfonate monooxygenase SsuD/methylene tetrahydromethanopterin reductase-like flavin-dependent oxidoreductase (luciferase family)
VTEKMQLGTLVTGITYRNPALPAKEVTTFDVISHGRAILGVGAGWFELEHPQLGYEFGTFSERFERLDEALQILVPMIEGKRPTFSGKDYCTESAIAEPRYRDHIPTIIGGGGEKKTFGLAARYCDDLNVVRTLRRVTGQARGSGPPLRRGRPRPLDARDQCHGCCAPR